MKAQAFLFVVTLLIFTSLVHHSVHAFGGVLPPPTKVPQKGLLKAREVGIKPPEKMSHH